MHCKSCPDLHWSCSIALEQVVCHWFWAEWKTRSGQDWYRFKNVVLPIKVTFWKFFGCKGKLFWCLLCLFGPKVYVQSLQKGADASVIMEQPCCPDIDRSTRSPEWISIIKKWGKGEQIWTRTIIYAVNIKLNIFVLFLFKLLPWCGFWAGKYWINWSLYQIRQNQ